MKHKHTLIKAIRTDDHVYLVTIGTDLGNFTGMVKCREEDWDHESQYFGFELAEHKAEIAWARAKKKECEARMGALTRFWAEMSKTRTFDQDAFWVKKIAKRIDELSWERHDWGHRIDKMKDAYHVKLVAFDLLSTKRDRCKEYNND